MEPDFQQSLKFLRIIYPSGPWMLTAITVNKKQIESRTFSGPEEDDGVLAWLGLNRLRNVYYCVNEPIPDAYAKTKLSKIHVSRVHFVHVDVDPRAGEDVGDEQDRIAAQIADYKMRPSVIVFSGGGYNVLWRLSEAVLIADGSLSDAETVTRAIDIERRNWQMELDFGTPDHCRDVCRILRLPGTVNRPDAKKVERGRTPTLARITYVSDVTYDLAEFMATPHVASNIASNDSVSVSRDVERVSSLDDLKIPDKLKVIIAQGFDPEEPRRWSGDRSATLFYVCCELIRLSIPDEVILGLITDSRYGISESVLDKGSGVMRYAVRQVERAKDHADDPLLEQMNRDFAVILGYGHTTVIMVEEGRMNVQTNQPEPIFQTFAAFSNRVKNYPTVTVPVAENKVKHVNAFQWWTGHRRRREFLDVTFQPGLDTPGRFNLWSGFAMQPVHGKNHERLLEHVYENICDGVQANYDYLFSWMARTVQYPRTQSMVAPVLIGEQGTGKSVFTDAFSGLVAPHRYIASDVKELTGKFNDHLGQTLVVVAEEAFDLRDKRHTSVLKELITGRTHGIERKGVDRILMPNYVHLIMTSNPDSANNRIIPAGDHERRFFVMRVGSKKRRQSSYFGPLVKDCDEHSGLSHLLYDLLAHSLEGFMVGDFPRTAALREQQEQNLSYELEWLLEKLETGRWFGAHDVSWKGPVKKQELHADYQTFMQSVGARNVKGARAFHKFIMKALPGTTDRQAYIKGDGRPMVFTFMPLTTCRTIYDDARGWASDWSEAMSKSERTPSNLIQMNLDRSDI